MADRRYTTCFEASENLAALLQSDGLGGATVSWGFPGQDHAEELVMVGPVRPADQETAAVGRNRRQEEYRIDVAVDLARRTDVHADLFRRMRDVVHAIERVVHDHQTLDGALHEDGWCEIRETPEVYPPQMIESGAYRVQGVISVFCTARI